MHFHCPEIMWCFFSPLCVCVCELMCMLFKQASNTTKNWFTSLCWIGKMDGRSVSWWFLLSDFFMRVFHSEREKSLFGVTITQLINLHVFHLFKKKKKTNSHRHIYEFMICKHNLFHCLCLCDTFHVACLNWNCNEMHLCRKKCKIALYDICYIYVKMYSHTIFRLISYANMIVYDSTLVNKHTEAVRLISHQMHMATSCHILSWPFWNCGIQLKSNACALNPRKRRTHNAIFQRNSFMVIDHSGT